MGRVGFSCQLYSYEISSELPEGADCFSSLWGGAFFVRSDGDMEGSVGRLQTSLQPDASLGTAR